MSHSDLFNMTNWGKPINGKSHYDRVKSWIKDNTGFDLKERSFKNVNDNFDTKFSNNIRISTPSSSVKIDEDKFRGVDGAGSNFISILGSWNEEDLEEELGAKYLGTSLVFFPCYRQLDEEKAKTKMKSYSLHPSGIIVSMGMGTGGPGQDESLVSNPGHIRRFEGMIKTIKLHDTSIPIWWRAEPLMFKQIPECFIDLAQRTLNAKPNSLYLRDESGGGYGQYLYAICVLTFDDNGNLNEDQLNLLKGFTEFYFRERGWKQNKIDDPSIKWYRELYNSITLEDLKTILEKQKYIILTGPPGTRKTELLSQLLKDSGDNISYQFHPSVTYQTFIGGIQPILNNHAAINALCQSTQVGFEFSIGPLLQAIEKAKSTQSTVLLALDEINRADLSSVLGEAIQLFEPTQKYQLLIKNYNNNVPIDMPINLKVIATMNTADRNISFIDVAIRRRFAFVNIWPEEPFGQLSCDYGRLWFNKCKSLFLEYGENNDLLLMPGGFYFLGSTIDEVRDTFRYRLVPLLEDYLLENRLTQLMKYELATLIQELRREL